MGDNLFAKLTEQYPYITLCLYAGVEYVCIVQNQDENITTIYDFGNIQDPELKRNFVGFELNNSEYKKLIIQNIKSYNLDPSLVEFKFI